MLVVLFLLAVHTATVDGQNLPVAGDNQSLWFVQADENENLTIFHRWTTDPPGLLRTAMQIRGKLIQSPQPPVAVCNSKLWLVLQPNVVQSIEPSQEIPNITQYTSRIEPALPANIQITALTATSQHLWVLARTNSPQAISSLPSPFSPTKTNTETTDLSASSTASESPTDTSPKPMDILLQLHRGRWQNVPLPNNWSHSGTAAITTQGSDQTTPVLVTTSKPLIHPLSATVSLYRFIPPTSSPPSTSSSTTPAVSDSATSAGSPTPPTDDSAAENLWQQQEIVLPITTAIRPICVQGQIVLAHRINSANAKEIQTGLYLLRPEAVSALPPISISPIDPAAPWTLTPAGNQMALVAQSQADRLLWSRSSLTGTAVPIGELRPQTPSPIQQLLEHPMLVPAIATAVLLMLIFWRRNPSDNQLLLPPELVLAELGSRFLAALIDFIPCLTLASFLWNVPWIVILNHWPGQASSNQLVLPSLTAIGLWIVYGSVSEMFTAKTIGKALLGLRVTTLNGQAPNIWQILARNILKALDLIFLALLAMAILNPNRQRLGDLVGKTVIVRSRRPEDDEKDEDL